jgi:hypothetical protein
MVRKKRSRRRKKSDKIINPVIENQVPVSSNEVVTPVIEKQVPVSSPKKSSYINRLRERKKKRLMQQAGWRKQFKSSYMSRLRSRKKSQKGGFRFKGKWLKKLY